jgi:hypothetical protein
MFFLWSKIKGGLFLILWGALGMLLPLLYLIGRKDGSAKEQALKAEEAAIAEKERAEFYKVMGEEKDEIVRNKPSSKHDLVTRLRDNGL